MNCNEENINTGRRFDAPERASDSSKLVRERADALKSRGMHYQLGQMDRAGEIPTLTGKLKGDWIDFPLDDILEQFTTLNVLKTFIFAYFGDLGMVIFILPIWASWENCFRLISEALVILQRGVSWKVVCRDAWIS